MVLELFGETRNAQRKHKPLENVARLWLVGVLVSQDQSVADAVQSIGVTQFTHYRWLSMVFTGRKYTALVRSYGLKQ